MMLNQWEIIENEYLFDKSIWYKIDEYFTWTGFLCIVFVQFI